MKKGLMLFILGFLVLCSFISASMIQTSIESDNKPDYNVEVQISKGWNLILAGPIYGIENNLISSDSEIQKGNIKAVYYYFRTENKYLQIYPNSGDMENYMENAQEKLDEMVYFAQSPVWIYSDKAGKLKYARVDFMNVIKFASEININYLRSGWNFITITPELAEKKLAEIKGNCNIQRAGFWIAESQEWYARETTEEDIISNEVGKGILFKVSSDCALGTITEPINPPTIPTDDSLSSVVPSENCQNGFDLVIDAFTRNNGSVKSVSLKAFNLANSTSSIICSYKKVGESCNYLGTEIKIISLEEDENDVITASLLVGSESFNYPQSNSFHKGCN